MNSALEKRSKNNEQAIHREDTKCLGHIKRFTTSVIIK